MRDEEQNKVKEKVKDGRKQVRQFELA